MGRQRPIWNGCDKERQERRAPETLGQLTVMNETAALVWIGVQAWATTWGGSNCYFSRK